MTKERESNSGVTVRRVNSLSLGQYMQLACMMQAGVFVPRHGEPSGIHVGSQCREDAQDAHSIIMRSL